MGRFIIGQRVDILYQDVQVSEPLRLVLTRSQGGGQYLARYPIRDRLEGGGKLDNSIIIILTPSCFYYSFMEFVPRTVCADFAAAEKGVAQWKGAATFHGRIHMAWYLWYQYLWSSSIYRHAHQQNG